MVCVGYVGCEIYDLVLYMSRILTKLNFKVLIVDLSDSSALLNSIKHGMELDSGKEIINYRSINYIRKIPSKDDMDIFDHGVVFVVHGNKLMNTSQFEYKSLNVVVDIFPHRIEAVSKSLLASKWALNEINVLIRDIITEEDVQRGMEQIKCPMKPGRISYLYHDINDYECAIECQTSQIVRFTKISKGAKRYMIEQIHEMLPQLSVKRIKRAMVLAKRGV